MVQIVEIGSNAMIFDDKSNLARENAVRFGLGVLQDSLCHFYIWLGAPAVKLRPINMNCIATRLVHMC